MLKKVHRVWVWLALCRKTRQVVAYALGDRSLPDVSTAVGSHPIHLPPGALLHGLLGGILGGHRLPSSTPPWACETGETAHVERWNKTLRQRLARFVRMTLSFSRVGGHA